MDRTSNRGRPKGSRGGRGKGKRGRKPNKVVVSDDEVETNQQEEVEVATNKNPEDDNANEKTQASEAVVADEPMETAEVIIPTHKNGLATIFQYFPYFRYFRFSIDAPSSSL